MRIVERVAERLGRGRESRPAHLLFDRASLERALAPRLIRTLAPEDQMIGRDLTQYWDAAFSALRFINLSLLAADRPAPRAILDFPCGHGRVLRMLHAAFPGARLTAVDLDPRAADFCAHTFGAEAVYSSPLPEQIPLRGPYDLIFCGSLLTHFAANRWHGFLSLFESLLVPEGLLVFTTHGEVSAGWISTGEFTYGLAPEQCAEMSREYRATGFAYRDYPFMPEDGISVSAVPWVVSEVARVPALRLVACLPRAWLDHQDVFAYQRRVSPRGR